MQMTPTQTVHMQPNLVYELNCPDCISSYSIGKTDRITLIQRINEHAHTDKESEINHNLHSCNDVQVQSTIEK